MSLESFTLWLAATPPSLVVQNVLWIVPAVQTVHLVAVAAVLSSMLMIGLRRIGVAARFQTVEQTVDRFLPWVWGGLAVLVVTGAVLIVGEPGRTLMNPAFWTKMVLLAVGVLWAAGLQRRSRGGRLDAATARHAPRGAVVLNLAVWCGVAVAGRWIAYVVT